MSRHIFPGQTSIRSAKKRSGGQEIFVNVYESQRFAGEKTYSPPHYTVTKANMKKSKRCLYRLRIKLT